MTTRTASIQKEETLAAFLESDDYQDMSLYERLEIAQNILKEYNEVIQKHNLSGNIEAQNIIFRYNADQFDSELFFVTTSDKLQSESLIETDKKRQEEQTAFDVYALGILCAQIITKKESDFFTSFEEGEAKFQEKDNDKTIPGSEGFKEIQPKIWELIQKMIDPDPNKRIGLDLAITEIDEIKDFLTPDMSAFSSGSLPDMGQLLLSPASSIGGSISSIGEIEPISPASRCSSQSLLRSYSSSIFDDAKPDESNNVSHARPIAVTIAAAVALALCYATLMIICPPSSLLLLLSLNGIGKAIAVTAGLAIVPALVAGATAYATNCALSDKSEDDTTATTLTLQA